MKYLTVFLFVVLLMSTPGMAAAQTNTTAASTNAVAEAPKTNALPRLLDLGAGKCVPCKLMVPVLEGLKTNYVGKLEVQFIDVLKNRDALKQYGVEVIPTQIFYDANGKELFRHIGFYSQDDIIAKWKELGVDLKAAK